MLSAWMVGVRITKIWIRYFLLFSLHFCAALRLFGCCLELAIAPTTHILVRPISCGKFKRTFSNCFDLVFLAENSLNERPLKGQEYLLFQCRHCENKNVFFEYFFATFNGSGFLLFQGCLKLLNFPCSICGTIFRDSSFEF